MDFFNFLFRDTMWGQIANQMNEYALRRQQHLGPDAVARMEHPDYKRFACQNLWKPVSIEDIRSVCCSFISSFWDLSRSLNFLITGHARNLPGPPFSECMHAKGQIPSHTEQLPCGR